MNMKYTLKDGSKISIFMWSEYWDGDISFRDTACVSEIKDGRISDKEISKKILKDEKGAYILWGEDKHTYGEKVYLMDFDYLPYDELMHKVSEVQQKGGKVDFSFLSNEDIFATFVKERDKVRVVVDMPMYEMYSSTIGIGMVGEDTVSCLCALDNSVLISSWSYQLSFRPIEKEIIPYVPSVKHLYFSDFCSMLLNGNCGYALTTEDEYYRVKAEVAQTYLKQKKEFFLKKFMKRK